MTTWFTADLHLGHSNIISYCDRPFTDTDAMAEALVEQWNDVVADGDTVWVLGDFALGRIGSNLPIAGELRGHKILVAGNHDRCWAGHGRRAGKWTHRYLEAGFADIRQGTVTITVGDTELLAGHFPYHGDSHSYDRYVEHRPPDTGEWLLHGHVHERWGQNQRMINVGVDVNDFRPISEAAVASLIRSGPTWRDHLG